MFCVSCGNTANVSDRRLLNSPSRLVLLLLYHTFALCFSKESLPSRFDDVCIWSCDNMMSLGAYLASLSEQTYVKHCARPFPPPVKIIRGLGLASETSQQGVARHDTGAALSVTSDLTFKNNFSVVKLDHCNIVLSTETVGFR